MRVKPRTRYWWSELVCEIIKTIEREATNADLKELCHDCLVILSYPSEYRNSKAFFERLDRLLDQVNGIEHETIGAKHLREYEERNQSSHAPTAAKKP